MAQIIRIVVRIPSPRSLIKSAGAGDWIFAEAWQRKVQTKKNLSFG
jgi:hypothetical protein